MRKNRVMLRALRMYNAYNPKYFPLYLLQIIFRNASFSVDVCGDRDGSL